MVITASRGFAGRVRFQTDRFAGLRISERVRRVLARRPVRIRRPGPLVLGPVCLSSLWERGLAGGEIRDGARRTKRCVFIRSRGRHGNRGLRDHKRGLRRRVNFHRFRSASFARFLHTFVVPVAFRRARGGRRRRALVLFCRLFDVALVSVRLVVFERGLVAVKQDDIEFALQTQYNLWTSRGARIKGARPFAIDLRPGNARRMSTCERVAQASANRFRRKYETCVRAEQVATSLTNISYKIAIGTSFGRGFQT